VKPLRLGPYIAGILASAALLAGCSAGGSQSSALGQTGLSPAQQGAYPNRGVAIAYQHMAAFPLKPGHRDHRKSWVSPDVHLLPRLLYVSDSFTLNIDVFTMPNLVLKGTITGAGTPLGLCDDKSGNIWAADLSGVRLVQYNLRTNGTAPLQTLDDATGLPVSCAVNSVNGDLAAANIFSFLGAGSVLIFKAGVGPPDQELTDPDIGFLEFVGYDGTGNLFATGTDAAGTGFVLAEATLLTSGSYGPLTTVPVTGGAIFAPGQIQWDRQTQTLVLGDQLCNDTVNACLYQATVSGGTAALGPAIPLLDSAGNPACDVTEFVISKAPKAKMGAAGSSLNVCNGDPNSVDRWHFPAGGTPTNSNTTDVAFPFGAALSVK
jgi:hypothetical protein